ncbi:class I SAM-dependent methyltransferase [Fundidesulfovibrio terrae]|uniref:class I SAM-dependent methyltransferase n=1 Tax=Fundidesulfovibrio terrae TaxID=2922866 RepID=UPI001FAEE092|nr:class I SAM-dependent methyltransferase [Fundidesulfovibrio terrae]
MDYNDTEWNNYRERFSKVYDNSNYSGGIQSLVMRESHKLSEKAFSPRVHFEKVLEVGSGTGEHFKYVRHTFSTYIITDADENALGIAKTKISNAEQQNIKFEVQSAENLSYQDGTFDRLLACHVLEHLYHPHLVLQEWHRVLKDEGVLSVLLPTDPGLAWRLGRHLGPRKNALAQGIAYDYIMAREHVNSCNNLIYLLRHYFPGAKESWWPLPIPSIDLNLFFAFHATVKK